MVLLLINSGKQYRGQTLTADQAKIMAKREAEQSIVEMILPEGPGGCEINLLPVASPECLDNIPGNDL